MTLGIRQRNHLTHLLLILAAAITFIVPTTALTTAADKIGWITFDGPMLEKPNPFGWLVGEDSGDTLLGMISKFDDAAARPDMPGVVLHLKKLQANSTQIFALRTAIDRVQAAGKSVYVYAEVYGPAEILLGSAADKMLIQPNSYVSFPGLYSEEMYLADTLQLVGLQADYVQVGAYKGASEQMMRSTPSKEWSTNINGLLDDLWEQMQEALKEGRGFSNRQLDRVLDKAWAAKSDEAIKLGLIDDAVDALDLKSFVQGEFDGASVTTKLGDGNSASQIDVNNPFALLGILSSEPDHSPTRDTIAIIHIDGPIIDGESKAAGLLGGESVGSRTIRKALKEIEDENLIKGLVIRINSPGGSALASEVIWQGVRRVAAKKPVYVSVGSMAASGGYYIAVSGDKIYVDPMSIVGSIGVVGGKVVWGGLYDKANIGITPRTRGPHAGMFGSLDKWTPAEQNLIRQMMSDTYDLFAERVVAGRGRQVNMSKIAEGRLFTGRQAVKNGMADGIAEFDEVITSLATDTGLPKDSYDVMTYPGPMSFGDMMEQMLPFASIRAPTQNTAVNEQTMDHFVRGAGAAMLRQVIGKRNWPQVRDSLNGLMLLQDEPVLLIAPRIIIVN